VLDLSPYSHEPINPPAKGWGSRLSMQFSNSSAVAARVFQGIHGAYVLVPSALIDRVKDLFSKHIPQKVPLRLLEIIDISPRKFQ